MSAIETFDFAGVNCLKHVTLHLQLTSEACKSVGSLFEVCQRSHINDHSARISRPSWTLTASSGLGLRIVSQGQGKRMQAVSCPEAGMFTLLDAFLLSQE